MIPKKEGDGKAGLLQKLPPSFPGNCKAGKHTLFDL